MDRANKNKRKIYEINHLVISPIENFISNQDRIVLTPHLSIVQSQALTSPLEKALLGAYDDYRLTQFDDTDFVDNFSHLLCWHIQEKFPDPIRDRYDILVDPHRQTSELIKALRIVKNDHIEVRCSTEASFLDGVPELAILPNRLIAKFPEFAKYKYPFISYTRYEHQMSNFFPSQPTLGICRLDSSDEISYLRAIMSILDKGISALRIAVTRVGGYYSRYDVADQIIDSVIALEILYLFGQQGDLNYRLSLRVAAHLGGADSMEKERLFNLTKTAYNLRNGIAHGGLYSIKDIENDKEFKKTGYHSIRELLVHLLTVLKKGLRSIIMEVGENRFKANSFHKALDRCILTGTPFTLSELPPEN